MHFDLVVPMWFAWLFYVIFGGVALIYLLIAFVRVAACIGLHGPYCDDLDCKKWHMCESKRKAFLEQERRDALSRALIQDMYKKAMVKINGE